MIHTRTQLFPSGALNWIGTLNCVLNCGRQSYKHFTIVNYDSSQYDSNVVIYDHNVLYKIGHWCADNLIPKRFTIVIYDYRLVI